MNQIGWGEYSSHLLQAITQPPVAPDQPLRLDSLSSKTSIAIKWTFVSDNADFTQEGGRVLGYRVYMAQEAGLFTLQASTQRNVDTFVVDNL